jgi:hypothetical protein
VEVINGREYHNPLPKATSFLNVPWYFREVVVVQEQADAPDPYANSYQKTIDRR